MTQLESVTRRSTGLRKRRRLSLSALPGRRSQSDPNPNLDPLQQLLRFCSLDLRVPLERRQLNTERGTAPAPSNCAPSPGPPPLAGGSSIRAASTAAGRRVTLASGSCAATLRRREAGCDAARQAPRQLPVWPSEMQVPAEIRGRRSDGSTAAAVHAHAMCPNMYSVCRKTV